MKDILIVVPYRNREEHLKGFLENSPAYFDKTGLSYDILICELDQIGDWNAGLSVNSLVDFIGTTKKYEWLYIHHVDIWPIEGEWKFPKQNEVYFNLGDYGSCLMKMETFFKVKGYCNSFWGWGGEDNELYQKLKEDGYNVINYETLQYVKYNVGFQNHPRNFNGKNYANAIKQSMIVQRHERNNILHFHDHAYTKDLIKLQENVYKHIVCPTQKSPDQTINRNLVITYLNNETDFNKLVSFTKSSQLHAPYEYDVVAILTDETPEPWLLNQLQTFGIKCVLRKPILDNPYLDRYLCYKEFLETDTNYTFILHADIRDLIFQANPFYEVAKDKITFVKQNETITTGAFCGPKNLFVQACDLIEKSLLRYDVNSKKIDETILTDLFLKQEVLKEEVEYKTSQDTFCIDLEKEKNANIYNNRKVYNKHNRPYAIVHQYDSNLGLQQTVDQHFLNYYFPL